MGDIDSSQGENKIKIQFSIPFQKIFYTEYIH